MKKRYSILAILGLAGSSWGLVDESEVAAIRAVRESSNAAIVERDLEALHDTWLPEVNVLASTGNVFAGGQAMADAFAAAFDDPTFITYRRILDDITLSEGGEAAAESGTWQGSWRKADGELVIEGTYQAQWRKVDGHWRIRGEVFIALGCHGSSECAGKVK